MIAIIDYKAGNVASVKNAFTRIGADTFVTNNIEELNSAKAVIFPGVGHAKPAMERLKESGLDVWLKSTKKPVLGICLGMQLLFSSTEEGDTECLNIIPGRLQKFDSSKIKTPHMGWNTIQKTNPDTLLGTENSQPFFYFVHSYFAPVTNYTTAICAYQLPFSAVVKRDNFSGVQFHPEKSGQAGRNLLEQFLKTV